MGTVESSVRLWSLRMVVALSLAGTVSAGCLPMQTSIYRAVDSPPISARGICNWPSLWFKALELDGVRIDLGFTGSSGIGIFSLGVAVAAGAELNFVEQEISIESAELAQPAVARFGRYSRGIYGTIGRLVGPTRTQVSVESIYTARPASITVRLPVIDVNGKAIRPFPMTLELTQEVRMVGLCQ